MSDEEHEDPIDAEPLRSEQPTVDAGSKRQAKKRESAQKVREREAKHFWDGVFASEVGRREMWKLYQLCSPNSADPFVVGPNGFPNSDATWFAAGVRSFGHQLYHRWMRDHPQEVVLMNFENNHLFSRGNPNG